MPIVAFLLCAVLWPGLVRSAAVVFGRWLIRVLPRWPLLIFPVVGNHLRRFLGRPFILVFALRKSPDGHRAEHCYQQ